MTYRPLMQTNKLAQPPHEKTNLPHTRPVSVPYLRVRSVATTG